MPHPLTRLALLLCTLALTACSSPDDVDGWTLDAGPDVDASTDTTDTGDTAPTHCPDETIYVDAPCNFTDHSCRNSCGRCQTCPVYACQNGRWTRIGEDLPAPGCRGDEPPDRNR